MSTFTGVEESRPIASEEELYPFFQQFAKPSSERRLGIECEFFGIERETGKGLPYLGPRGIEAILCRMAAACFFLNFADVARVLRLAFVMLSLRRRFFAVLILDSFPTCRLRAARATRQRGESRRGGRSNAR